MRLKKTGIFLLFSIVWFGNSYAISNPTDSVFLKTNILANRYLNYNCSTSNDSVIKICREAIDWSTVHDHHLGKLYAEQLLVNALCLEGDIEQGITIAKEMYKAAKASDSPLEKGLALQAIASTYMHTGQYTQAQTAFSEAHLLINAEHDTLSKARLIIQQLHNYMWLDDTTHMTQYLVKLDSIIPNLPNETQSTYLFYALCYEAMLNIKTRQAEKAQETLEKMSGILPGDSGFNIWRYTIQKAFYQLIGNDKQMAVYLDSTLLNFSQYRHSSVYRNAIYEKADWLEKNKDTAEACRMYALADSLTNILNMEHYIQRIEDLHLAYHIDQVAFENARLRNKYLSIILLCSLITIIISILLIVKAKKRNRQLTLSREKLDKMRQTTADSIQSKSIFLSNMSHDLRTPLNAIVGFSDILTTTEDVDPELKEQCRDYIKQNSDLLIKLVNDIIDFSTLKEAKIKFDFGKYDVVSLCHSVVETVAKVKKTEARLTFTSTVEHLEIETDSERLQQVLINLLTNAAKFTKSGTIRLLLDFNRQTNKAIFTVEDTGCGIPLEKQVRIFERFEKLHESVQGVGLGLSICKLIIDHVGGNIWIDSNYTEGARFIFTHPINLIPKNSGV